MLDKKEPSTTTQKTSRKSGKRMYKEIMKEELKRGRDAYLLRHPKKKSGIRKRKEWNAKLSTRHTQHEPSVVEEIESKKKKEDESYQERLKVWKEDFKTKGKVASSITKSVLLL
jgi:hypothetical protein